MKIELEHEEGRGWWPVVELVISFLSKWALLVAMLLFWLQYKQHEDAICCGLLVLVLAIADFIQDRKGEKLVDDARRDRLQREADEARREEKAHRKRVESALKAIAQALHADEDW
jgi:hypothetical protein